MKISKTLAISAFAFSVALVGTSAQAAKVKWKMHSAWGSQVPHLGGEAVRFAEDIGKISAMSYRKWISCQYTVHSTKKPKI